MDKKKLMEKYETHKKAYIHVKFMEVHDIK